MTKRSPNFGRILVARPPRSTGATASADEVRTEASRDAPLAPAESDAIVTLSHLMATADDAVSDDESDAFAALLLYLAGGDAAEAKRLDALVERLDAATGSFEDRARAAAQVLQRRAARDSAYQAAYTIRVWDLESNPAEDELDDLLVSALGLTHDEAAELAQRGERGHDHRLTASDRACAHVSATGFLAAAFFAAGFSAAGFLAAGFSAAGLSAAFVPEAACFSRQSASCLERRAFCFLRRGESCGVVMVGAP